MSILASNNVFPHDPDDNWRSKTDKGGCELTTQELLNKINEYVAPDDIIVPGTISKVGSVISILALAFTCRIDQQILRNIDDYSTTIANATEGFKRIDILVFTKFSTIIKIQGTESILDVQEPSTPEGTLKLAFISVFGSEILNPEVPIANGLYKEKSESQNIILTESGDINILTMTDERTSIVFSGTITKLNTIRYPWEVAKVYNGKIVTLYNRQSTDVIISHAATGGSVDFNFPDGKDYVLKPNQVISFFYDLSFYPYAHHMFIGETGKEDQKNKSVNIDADKTSDTKYGSVKAIYTWAVSKFQSTLISGTNIKTVNGTTLLGSGNILTPDMDTTNPQEVSGLKTFLSGRFGFRNVANTFTSFFANSNTASRTYTLRDRNGILADDTDLATKQNVFAGVQNYIAKSLNANTLVPSRLLDTGTSIGIDTINTPLKDITLSALSNKDIGIEDSDSLTVGKELVISAGRTVNFIISFLFQSLNTFSGSSAFWFVLFSDNNNNVYAGGHGLPLRKQTNSTGDFVVVGSTPSGSTTGGCVTNSGDIYLAIWGVTIYKQTGGSGAWVSTGAPALPWISMCAMPNGDVYASGGQTGPFGGSPTDIYKQTGGTGAFVAMGFTARSYFICSTPSGDLYASVRGGSIYKMSAGASILVDLIQTVRLWGAITSSPSGGDVYACVENGDVYKQTGGTGNFIGTGQVSRPYGCLTISKSFNMYTAPNAYNASLFYVNLNALGSDNLDGGILKLKSGTGKGTGKSRVQIVTGQKTISGTNMQQEVVRAEFYEDGNYKRIGTPIFPDNTSALAGGLTAGMEYRTSSGVKMEVY